MRSPVATWVALLALAGAAACTEGGLFVESQPGVGVGIDEPDDACQPRVSLSQVELYGPGSSDTLSFEVDCDIDVEVSLDDPEAAFDVQPTGSVELFAGEPQSLDVQLLASEPGSYEAQILIDNGVSSRTVEVFALIEQEQ